MGGDHAGADEKPAGGGPRKFKKDQYLPVAMLNNLESRQMRATAPPRALPDPELYLYGDERTPEQGTERAVAPGGPHVPFRLHQAQMASHNSPDEMHFTVHWKDDHWSEATQIHIFHKDPP